MDDSAVLSPPFWFISSRVSQIRKISFSQVGSPRTIYAEVKVHLFTNAYEFYQMTGAREHLHQLRYMSK
jgi:hypothetical protein